MRSMLDHMRLGTSQLAPLTPAQNEELLSSVHMDPPTTVSHTEDLTLALTSTAEAYEAVRCLLILLAPPSPQSHRLGGKYPGTAGPGHIKAASDPEEPCSHDEVRTFIVGGIQGLDATALIKIPVLASPKIPLLITVTALTAITVPVSVTAPIAF